MLQLQDLWKPHCPGLPLASMTKNGRPVAVPEEGNDSPATWLDPLVKVSFVTLNLELSKGAGEEKFHRGGKRIRTVPYRGKSKKGRRRPVTKKGTAQDQK